MEKDFRDRFDRSSEQNYTVNPINLLLKIKNIDSGADPALVCGQFSGHVLMFIGLLMMRWNFAVVRQQLSWLRKPAHSDDFTVPVSSVCWFAGMACVSVSAMLHQFRGVLR